MLNREICVKCFDKWYHKLHEPFLEWAELHAKDSQLVRNYEKARADFLDEFDSGLFTCHHNLRSFTWSIYANPPEDCLYVLEHVVSDNEMVEQC